MRGRKGNLTRGCIPRSLRGKWDAWEWINIEAGVAHVWRVLAFISFHAILA